MERNGKYKWSRKSRKIDRKQKKKKGEFFVNKVNNWRLGGEAEARWRVSTLLKS